MMMRMMMHLWLFSIHVLGLEMELGLV